MFAGNVWPTKFLHPIKALRPTLPKYRFGYTVGPLWAQCILVLTPEGPTAYYALTHKDYMHHFCPKQ